MSDHRTPQAILIPLAEEPLPQEIEPTFRAAGFGFRQGDWQSIADEAVEDPTIHLLWTGRDWQQGLRRIGELPEDRRSTLVLTGERPEIANQQRAQGTIPSLLRLGALAGVSLPIPEWFLVPLREAIGRLGRSYQRQLSRAVEEIQRDLGETPESLLYRTAKAAGQLLSADLVAATLKSHQTDRFEVLLPDDQGLMAAQRWLDDGDRRRTPKGLTALFRDQAETIVVPSATHFRHCEVGEGPEPFEGAMIRLIQIPGLPGRRPLVACMNLFWHKPHLPTPNEYLALEILAALAKATVARLVEQERLAAIHSRSRQAFFDALEVPKISSTEALQGLPTETQTLSTLVKTVAEAYAVRPGLRDLWVRLPDDRKVTVPGGEWLSVGEGGGQQPPRRTSETGSKLEIVEVSPPENGWAVQTPWVSGRPHLGELIAVFASNASARAAQPEIERLAHDLHEAARQQRRASDTATLLDLATTPLEPGDPWKELRATLDRIQQQTHSDGAKVFVMLQKASGAKIWRLCSTDHETAAATPVGDPGRGLSGWVLSHQDWLLIPRLTGSTGNATETGISGKEREDVRVQARSERDFLPGLEEADNEDTMLFVPLTTRGRATGVLAIWRDRHEGRPNIPYDEKIDPEALGHFAPHVASSCQRILQLQTAQKQLTAISDLALRLTEVDGLAEAYDAVTQGVCEVADAALALLLHHDREQTGDLYLSSWWCAVGDDGEAVAESRASVAAAVQRFRLATNSAQWRAQIERGLGSALEEFTFRGLLVPQGSQPPLVVALFDRSVGEDEPTFVSDEVLEHFAMSFLQTACALLEEYPSGLASRLIDQIGSSGDWSHASPADVLEQGARLLEKATGADATLIYLGTPKQMTVHTIWPQEEALNDLRIEPHSYTERTLREVGPVRVLDVAAHGEGMNRQNLQRFAKAFGWAGVGSWLCCSVVREGRSIGLIKLMTRHDGAFLGRDHARMTHLIAERTAVEMYKANSRQQLQNLLQLSDQLATFRGTRLEREMAEELRNWVRRTLSRPSCRVAIVARIPEEKTRLARVGSGEMPERLLQRLEEISMTGSLAHEGGATSVLPEAPGAILLHRPPGIACPIGLPGEDRLSGHVFVLDAESFYPDDLEAIGRAAHYIALVLNGERERMNWRQVMGRFRHALLGPVQGLTSAAKRLVADLSEPVVEEDRLQRKEIQELRSQILEEAQIIRLWRKNQRLYLNDHLETVPKKTALKPIVERCVRRYRPVARSRNITLSLDWRPAGELQVMIDPDAIDIALSNLVENACKYAFYNRSITVGTRLEGNKTIELWVEDVGHPIPEHVDRSIYEFGQRAARQDPLRSISGQGIGLAMVMAVVMAHDGSLSHSCDQLGSGRNEKTTPFRVRFTIDLPWSIV